MGSADRTGRELYIDPAERGRKAAITACTALCPYRHRDGRGRMDVANGTWGVVAVLD
jgi:hypothetical protein